MSSGFNLSGGRSRCFPFWQELVKCHVQTDDMKECLPNFKDYRECLYHTKEVTITRSPALNYIREKD